MVDWKNAARNFFLREGELQRSDWSWQYIALLVVAGFAGWLLLPLFPNYGLVVGGLVLSGFSLLLIYVKKNKGGELSPVELLVVGVLLFFTWWYVAKSLVVAGVILAIIVLSFGFPTFASYMTVFFGVFVVALLGLGLVDRITGGEYVSVLALIAVVALLFLPVAFLSLIQRRQFAEEKTHNGEKLLAAVLSSLLLVFFFLTSLPWVEVSSPLSNSAVLLKTALKSIPVEVGKFSKSVQRSYEREIAVASGDFAASQIDAESKRDVGVELSDLRASERRFFVGSPVSFFSKVDAQVLDAPMSITASCAHEKARLVGPCASQDNTCSFTVEGKESANLDCVIDAPDVGTQTIALSAVFDFTTRAYLPVYFMEKEKLQELRRRNLDPLEGFDVRSPVATTTRGPVRVGVAVGSQPVGVSVGDGVGPTIAVTIDNVWDGVMKEIKDIVVFLPKGLQVNNVVGARVTNNDLKNISCSDLRGELDEEAKLCDDSLHNVYILSPESREDSFESFVSFRLYTDVNSAERGIDLLGPTPVTVRNIRVSTRYSYELKQEAVFTVEERVTA